jgi:hypothetical protein
MSLRGKHGNGLNAAQLKPGDVLVCESFGCIPRGEHRAVEMDHRGAIFIRCNCGRHFLAGKIQGLRRIIPYSEAPPPHGPYRPGLFVRLIAKLLGSEIREY